MKITATFKEIHDIINKEFNLRLHLNYIDDKSVELSYRPSAILPAISLKLHIDAMRSDVVCLSYECENATAMLIAGAMAYMGDKLPEGVEVKTDDKRIIIYPHRIEKLEGLLEVMTLSDICFGEKEVNIAVTLS